MFATAQLPAPELNATCMQHACRTQVNETDRIQFRWSAGVTPSGSATEVVVPTQCLRIEALPARGFQPSRQTFAFLFLQKIFFNGGCRTVGVSMPKKGAFKDYAGWALGRRLFCGGESITTPFGFRCDCASEHRAMLHWSA